MLGRMINKYIALLEEYVELCEGSFGFFDKRMIFSLERGRGGELVLRYSDSKSPDFKNEDFGYENLYISLNELTKKIKNVYGCVITNEVKVCDSSFSNKEKEEYMKLVLPKVLTNLARQIKLGRAFNAMFDSDSEDKIRVCEENLERMESRVDDLSEELDDLRSEVTQIEYKTSDHETEISNLEENIDMLQRSVQSLEDEINN